MKFTVVPEADVFFEPSPTPKNHAFLYEDNWDDWFRWNTKYSLVYWDAEGNEHHIGGVKIASTNIGDERRAKLPREFEGLDESFFSLGQHENYYVNLNRLGAEIRVEILASLQDLAFRPERVEEFIGLPVVTSSLMRSVPLNILKGRFHRLTKGDARLTSYKFSYRGPILNDSAQSTPALEFEVHPNSEPPSNVHVIVGRNGVGKTRYLKLIQLALLRPNPFLVGEMLAHETNEDHGLFANLISVSFSAFDPFDDLPVPPTTFEGMSFSYVGLRKRSDENTNEWRHSPKELKELGGEFVKSFHAIKKAGLLDRWRRALEILESDPLFKEIDVVTLAESDQFNLEAWTDRGFTVFERLSSGHKIVLLTMTRLVEDVVERSLILLDEPESHLHPPLLSSFVRALSDLLIQTNGVAIVATHSPVVLQEVPTSCVWKLWRSGTVTTAERPEIETFGENVGTLTREVFGLEVTQSGFHKMISDAARESNSYDEVIWRFGKQLGGEAKAIIRGLLATDPENEDL